MIREITDDASKIILKKNFSFLEGRSAATAAIAFTVMSASVMALKSTAAWGLNNIREQNKGMAPLLIPVAGAAGGYALSKVLKNNLGFGFGLMGFIGGSALSLITPSSMLKDFFSLGRGSMDIDHTNYLASAELSSFISTIKNRVDNNKASRLELMAGIYAQTYSSMLSIGEKDNSRFTHVVARQSPLPIIQFFYAATTENQVRDENGNIISPGQTRFTTGIQTAPILGGSFSVGLPITITPGGGVLGMTYSDKSNVLELLTGVQTAVVSLTAGLLATKLFATAVKGTLAKVGLSNNLHNEHYIDTLFDITRVFNEVGTTLLAETPARIVSSMVRSDIDLIGNVMKPTKDLASYSIPTYAVKHAFVKRNAKNLGKYLMAGAIGGYIGGTLAVMIGASDRESLESSSTIGTVGGSVAGAGVKMISSNYDMAPMTSAVRNRLQISNRINPPSSHPIVSKRVGSYLSRGKAWGASVVAAGAIATLLTDSDFGIAEDMDSHNLTRAGIIGLYALAVGSTFHYFGNTFMDASDTFRKWYSLEQMRSNLQVVAGEGNFISNSIKRVRLSHVSMMQKGVEKDTNRMLESIHRNKLQIETLRVKTPNDVVINDLVNVSDDLATAVAINTTESSITRRMLKDMGQSEVDDLGQIVMKGRAKIARRVDPVMGMSRFYRGGLAIVGFTLAFSTVAGQLGNGSIEEGMNKIYADGGLLDWGKEQGGVLHGISNVVSSTLKLITRTDTDNEIPSEYREFLVDYIETETGGSKGKIRRSTNLVRARNNPMAAVSDLISSTEKMFIMNSPNAFIQVAGPVGFTFRAGEYGKRVNRYVQIQSPGADISTASYSIAASFGFGMSLSGRYDTGFNIQTAVRQLNDYTKRGIPIDEVALRRASINILASTAKTEPLKKRRRYSTIDLSSLDLITVDPLLSASLNYRKQMLENMASQSAESLGTRMIMEASTNHVLGDVGLLKALFSREADSLKVLLDDPFGLLTRNIVIRDASVFQTDGKGRSTKKNIGEEQSAWMDTEAPYQGIKKGSSLPFVAEINNTISSIWGSMPSIFKWTAAIGITGIAAVALTYTLGAMAINSETNAMIDKVNEFYSSNLYDVRVNRKGAAYGPIQASYRKSVGGQIVTGVDGRRVIEISKGNNLFTINQSFSEEPAFAKRLNAALIQFQDNINELHINYSEGKTFGQIMQEHVVSDRFQQSVSTAIDEIAADSGITPKEVLNTKLKEAYKGMLEEYTTRYLKVLGDTYIDTTYDNKSVRVSLLTLLSGDGVKASDILSFSGSLQKGELSALEVMQGITVDTQMPTLMGGSFISNHSKKVEEIVDGIVEEVITKSWVSDDSMLSKGRVFSIDDSFFKGAMNHVNDKISHALSSNTDSPLFLIKNYFGGVAQPTNVDRFRRELKRLGSILRLDNGLDLDDEAIDLINQMPQVATTRRVVNLSDNSILNSAEVRHISRQITQEMVDQSGDHLIIAGKKKGTVVKISRNTAEEVLRRSGVVDDISPSSVSMAKARAMYRGYRPLVKGATELLELGGFAFDIFESVNVFGTYSRLGASYTSGSYTRAQRKSLAIETGHTTTNTLIAGAIGAAMVNMGAITTAVGTTLLGGAAAVGAVSAGVVGGLFLLGAGILLGLSYFLMPKKWRKKVNSAAGSIHSSMSQGIGTGLMALGDSAKSMFGARAASASINAIGGLLGGVVIGLGLVSMGVFSTAVASAIGVSAFAGAGLGIIGGLLMPNQMGNLSRTISSYMGGIPFLGSLFSKEGNWLANTGETITDSPFFTGTANQAIQAEFERHMSLVTEDSGTAMSQILVAREVYGSSSGYQNYVSSKSDGLIGRITPGNMVDPTLARELRARSILYSHTIVSRYIWTAVVSSASNKRAIRAMENKYRSERFKELEQLEREAKAISSSPTSSRRSTGDLKVSQVLIDTIIEVDTAIKADKREASKVLVTKINKKDIANNSLARQVRDLSIDRVPVQDLTNKISSADGGGIKVRAEVDEERDYIRAALAINLST
jgi:hypothetical protein